MDDSEMNPICGCLCCERSMGKVFGQRVVTAYHDWESRFWQQNEWAWKVYIYPKNLMAMYWILAVVLSTIGALQLAANNSLVQSERVRYDNRPECDVGAISDGIAKTCTISFSLPADAKAPIYFYYSMDKYFQGTRSYVSSFASQQLAGQWPVQDSTYSTQCEPRVTPNPAPPVPPFSVQPGDVLLPCGVLPWSIFNDTMQLYRDANLTSPLSTSKRGLTFFYEKEEVYLPGPSEGGYDEATNAFITSDDFIVWMRQSVFNVVVKPMFRIEEDLKAGTYYVEVNASYPVAGFEGTKSIHATTLTFINSGRNVFLGVSYIVFGGLSAIIASWLIYEIVREKKSNMTSRQDDEHNA